MSMPIVRNFTIEMLRYGDMEVMAKAKYFAPRSNFRAYPNIAFASPDTGMTWMRLTQNIKPQWSHTYMVYMLKPENLDLELRIHNFWKCNSIEGDLNYYKLLFLSLEFKGIESFETDYYKVREHD